MDFSNRKEGSFEFANVNACINLSKPWEATEVRTGRETPENSEGWHLAFLCFQGHCPLGFLTRSTHALVEGN